MVRVQGPMFSFGASGTIGKAATFSRWKGRFYVRERIIPANPKSANQTGMRAMMKFLSQMWSSIVSADQESWEDLADAQAVSNFNAYIQFNQRKWRDFQFPTQKYPYDLSKLPGAISSSQAEASGRDIQVTLNVDSATDQWGVAIFLSTSQGFSPNWNNARLLAYHPGGAPLVYTIGPLDPGTYYLRYYSFAKYGKEDSTYTTEDSVTIE